jgi:hypothetical protein
MQNNISHKYNIGILLLLVFIISPFFSLIIASFYLSNSIARFIILLFCFYFGFIFIVPKTIGFDSYDSLFYSEQLLNMYNENLSFNNFIISLYNIDSMRIDVYQPLITWIVSIFTSNYNYLFAIFGLVFGFFNLKSILVIINNSKFYLNFYFILIIITYVLINPIWNINGVRMYTAMSIFIYGVYLFFIKKEKMGVFYMVISALVHLSFIIPIIFFYLFNFFYIKKTNVYFYTFLIAFILKNNFFIEFGAIVSYLPDYMQYKYFAYSDDEYIDSINEKSKLVSNALFFSNLSLQIIIYSSLFITHYYREKLFNSLKLIDLKYYNFILFTFTWSTIVSVFPSGGRFLMLAFLMLFSVLIINFSLLSKEIGFKNLKFILTPFYIYFIIFSIRVGFDFYNISLFFGGPISLFFNNDINPIIYYFK